MTGDAKNGGLMDTLEESLIALILGLMTVITFANVVARYVFNSNILWALETTVFLFAWLVLLGASYCIKTRTHLGVDIVINAVSPATRSILAILSVICCLAFAILLLIGAWQYWSPFIGRQVWYEVNDIPMPEILRFIEPLMNEGEAYNKMPRFIPYFALPLGMVLITFRFIQAAWQIFRGETDRLIASHEAEELVAEASANVDRTPDRGGN
ncbi:MAG: TRAP transporter small permease [Pseudomonadota bacterium]